KYILPDEGTMNFAIMYIPSEAMFSRLFSDIRLLRGCLQLGVVPASPSNLFLYVQTVSYGLRGMEFSRNFSRYAGQFEQIRLQIGKLAEILATGHGHLRNLQRSYDAVLHGLDGVQERLNEI
ncbi:MAG: DNA recombination protein RmuC, partial [Spirochaeta sp.]